MQFENPPTTLHQQLALLRGDSTLCDVFNNNQVPFDFPEVELANRDSIAISLGFGLGGEHHFEFKQESKEIKEDDDIVGDDSEDGDIDSNQAMMDNSFGSLLEEEAKFTKHKKEISKELKEIEEIQKVKKTIKKEKKQKKQPKKKKSKGKKKNKKREVKVRKERKVTMHKSSHSIMQSLAMDMDGIFKLYPTLKQKICEQKMHKISTFPTVFSTTDNFCLPPNPEKFSKGNLRSQKTKSTLDCEIQDMGKNFGEMKSTLVRSKVNNLKGSMLCFEMHNNLREMVQISKCMKWNRRLKYRKELAERESGSGTSNSGDDSESYSEYSF